MSHPGYAPSPSDHNPRDQARSAFQDELLENLADGQAESVTVNQGVEKPAYTNLLIGGMVAEAVVILVLIIVLIMK